ncbi:MAG TPA: TetR/AcrR family transcriptional regulator [Candidatus Saccharimonadales bacterium]|nr:TetR/AcrR family transcriptional regulator [Candidatus Saccharimonadales bacterium]
MSAKSRPSREEVHSSIILKAREIAATDGWAAVTVRKVAERIGYTAPIIYEHFGSKDEMLNQVLKEGYDTLHDEIAKAVECCEKKEDRLREMAMAYWNFAHATPELYQLMYGMEGARATSEAARDYAIPMATLIAKEMMRFNPEQINKDNVAVVMIEAWSVVHGMIALDISGYTARYMKSEALPDILFNSLVQILSRQRV